MKIITLIGSILLGLNVSAQNMSMLESKQYRFVATAVVTNGKSEMLTKPGALVLKGDAVSTSLPGISDTAEKTISSYKVKAKKRAADVTIEANGLNVDIEVAENNTATLTIKSAGQQSSYNGYLRKL